VPAFKVRQCRFKTSDDVLDMISLVMDRKHNRDQVDMIDRPAFAWTRIRNDGLDLPWSLIRRRKSNFPISDENSTYKMRPMLDLLENPAHIFADKRYAEQIKGTKEQDDKNHSGDTGRSPMRVSYSDSDLSDTEKQTQE
jgi:hypothetical protein